MTSLLVSRHLYKNVSATPTSPNFTVWKHTALVSAPRANRTPCKDVSKLYNWSCTQLQDWLRDITIDSVQFTLALNNASVSLVGGLIREQRRPSTRDSKMVQGTSTQSQRIVMKFKAALWTVTEEGVGPMAIFRIRLSSPSNTSEF